MAGLIDLSSPTRALSSSYTENLTSRFYRVENFGFLKLTSDEKFAQNWYPTPNDIIPAGWFSLDIHNGSQGDFNGDGLADLLLQPMLFQHRIPRLTEISPLLLIQNRNGSFESPSTIIDQSAFPKKHFLYRIGVDDFNGDGRADAALSAMEAFAQTPSGITAFYQSPLVLFGSEGTKLSWIDTYKNFSVRDLSARVQGYTHGHSIATGDFNGDSYPDFFSNWYVFYNNKSGGFQTSVLLPNGAARIESSTGNSDNPYGSQWWWPLVNASTTGDFDKDGYEDLIFSAMPNLTAAANGGDLMLVRGSAQGLLDGSRVIPLARVNEIQGNVGTNFIVSLDINGDTNLDILFIEHHWTTDSGDSKNYYTKAKLRAYFGDGRGGFIEQANAVVDPYSGHRQGEGNIHVSDVNGDGWKDIVLSGYPVNLTDNWFSPSSHFNYSTVFLNDKGVLKYVDPSDLAFVQPYQYSGDESLKRTAASGVSKLFPVDIGNDGMVDFVGFVQTALRAWPQVEQQYTYAYISRAIAPLGREAMNEYLIGTKGDDLIWGFDGSDRMFGDAGNDTLDGGSGVDTVIFDGKRGEHTVLNRSGEIFVSAQVTKGGSDLLKNVERLKFSDISVALDLDGNAGKVAKLLGATFGKSAMTNKEYVGAGLSLLDQGMSYQDLAALAVSVTKKSSATDICNLLWANIFGKAPTAADIAPYKAMLDSGQISIGVLTTLAADTSFNSTNINLVGLSQTGIEYI